MSRNYPAVLSPFVVKPTGSEYPFFLEDLRKSGLTPEDVPDWYAVRGEGIGRFTRLTSSQGGGLAPSPGYAIPYRTLSGEPIQDMGEAFIRFRLQVPLTETRREDGTWKTGGKYLSPKDTGSHLYVPRATAALLLSGAGDDLPLVITEGEKKAEAVVRHTGIPCIALAGIHMWFDPDADRREGLAARKLHPELLAVLAAYTKWVDGRPVVLVVFDSDGAPHRANSKATNLKDSRDGRGKAIRVRNPDVHRAAVMLASRIYSEQQMGVAASATWCPEAEGEVRQGLDDWIVAAGAASVRDALLAWASRPDHKILNKHGLPAQILTSNVHADIEALTTVLRRHDDLYVLGSSLALIESDASSIYVVAHEGVLAQEISKLVQTFEENKDGGVKPCYIPPRLCTTMLQRDWERVSGLRQVSAMAPHPVPMLLGDEIYVSQPGYDARAGLFGAFSAEDWSIPEAPGDDEFSEACLTLGELIQEMYLQTPADMAAALAAMLTAVARPGLPVAPGFVLSAPNSGAGKSYFGQVLTELASTHEPDVLTLETRGPSANSEFSKMVLGALSTSRPVMLFDEIDDNKIDGPSLRKLITSPVFSGRKLGTNEVMTLPTRKLVLITANNVDPTQDSARRFIIVRINPPVDAAKRNQRPDRGAVDLVHTNRAKYARAAAIVSLAGMRMLQDLPYGMPVGIHMLSGFPAWSRVCAGPALLAAWTLIALKKAPVNLVEKDNLGQIVGLDPLLKHAEAINPMLRQKETLQMDPARLALRDLLDALHRFQTQKVALSYTANKFLGSRGEQGFTTELLVAELREQRHLADKYQRDYNASVEPAQFALLQELRAAGLRDDQMSNSRSLAKVLSTYRDKEVSGLALVQAGRAAGLNSNIWHVRRDES